jgi:tRNA (guanine-N7-)-methyltransferase
MRPLPPTDLLPYFQTLHDFDAAGVHTFDWRELFGNARPVEIDVGSGRGMHLVSAGTAHPDRNYLGIEVDYREGRRAARRLQKRSLENVRVLGADVHVVFRNYIVPQSVDAIHVYFPDPWWKRKHRRRRVFSDQFADECARLLKPGGLLHSWTDVEEYFGVISALMDNHPLFRTLQPPAESAPAHDLDYRTSFERRKRKDGLPIYRGMWERRGEGR